MILTAFVEMGPTYFHPFSQNIRIFHECEVLIEKCVTGGTDILIMIESFPCTPMVSTHGLKSKCL